MSRELVKDRVIEYLKAELAVPENMIERDVELAEYEEGVEGTLDLTVVAIDGDENLIPLMIVQCMDDDIELTNEVVEAQMDMLETIDQTTHVGRMVLTNGDQMMYADWNGTELTDENALPTYDEMVAEWRAVEKEYKDYVAEHPEYLEVEAAGGCGCGCDEHKNELKDLTKGGCCGGGNHEHKHEHGHEGCCGGKGHKEDGGCGCKH